MQILLRKQQTVYNKESVKQDAQPKAVEQKKKDECIGCPYRQSGKILFSMYEKAALEQRKRSMRKKLF